MKLYTYLYNYTFCARDGKYPVCLFYQDKAVLRLYLLSCLFNYVQLYSPLHGQGSPAPKLDGDDM